MLPTRMTEISTTEFYQSLAQTSVRLNWNDADEGIGLDRGAVFLGQKGGVIFQGEGYEIDVHKNAQGAIGSGSVVEIRREGHAEETRTLSIEGISRLPLPHDVMFNLCLVAGGADASLALHALPRSARTWFRSAQAETVVVSMRPAEVTVRQTTESSQDETHKSFVRTLETKLGAEKAEVPRWTETRQRGTWGGQMYCSYAQSDEAASPATPDPFAHSDSARAPQNGPSGFCYLTDPSAWATYFEPTLCPKLPEPLLF